jgi:hypothetical protein
LRPKPREPIIDLLHRLPTGRQRRAVNKHRRCRRDPSLSHDKNVSAVYNGPVATLPIPVAVLVGAPVSVVPVGVGMHHCGTGSGLDRGSGSGVDRIGVCDVSRRVCASLFVGRASPENALFPVNTRCKTWYCQNL